MDDVDRIRELLERLVAGWADLSDRAPSAEYADDMRVRSERGPEALVLRYGHAFLGTSWDTWRGRGYRRRKQGNCFQNALDYSWRYDDLTYVEGFALSDLRRPIQHAWCATADETVVDPTWPDDSPRTAYLGIPFPSELSAKLARTEGGNHLVALMLDDEVSVGQFDQLLRRADAG